MKVKELQAVLAKMEPDAEFNNCKAFQAFFDIAKESDIQDFENALECLGYKTEKISRNKLAQMNNEVQDRLANDDVYNQIYNNVVCDVAEENNLEVE